MIKFQIQYGIVLKQFVGFKESPNIIFTPYWVSFPDFVSVTGATPVYVKTDHKKQFEVWMWGEELMESDDKGSLQTYKEKD